MTQDENMAYGNDDEFIRLYRSHTVLLPLTSHRVYMYLLVLTGAFLEKNVSLVDMKCFILLAIFELVHPRFPDLTRRF